MQTKSNYSLAACSHFVFTTFPYENLGDRGFYLDESLNREEHGVLIQTLLVQTPDANAVCLEFRDILDEEEFLANCKIHNPSARGREVLRPSVRLYGEEAHQLSIGDIPITVLPVAEKKLTAPTHANSVTHIWGLYLYLTSKGIEEWNQFLGVASVNNEWVLKDGTRIVAATRGDGLYEFMERRKDFPFWAVILKSQSFSEFKIKAEPERIFDWRGVPMALIKEHLTDWDLLVI
ncbi:MAG: hypothetical protein RJB66_2736 [Pseudomonadota bacterium]